MNVLIMGRSEMLYETARFLADKHTICGIITAPAAPEYSRDEEDFYELAQKIGCPYLFTGRLDSGALQFITDAAPEIAVSVNWVSTIAENVTRLIPGGILNAHLGDLPRYRGNAVVNWAMIKNEPAVTFTVHFMEPGELDSGSIMVQRKFNLTPQTTIKDLIDFAAGSAPEMFAEALCGLESGTVKPEPQDEIGNLPFRCYPRIPLDSKIDWYKSAAEIDRLVRASTRPYSGAYSYLKIKGAIKKLYVWKSRVVADTTVDIGTPGHIIKNDGQSGESWVYTGKGILAICLAQYESEKDAFRPGRVWRSIRMRFGIDIESEIINIHKTLSEITQKLEDNMSACRRKVLIQSHL